MLSIIFYKDCGIRSSNCPLVAGRSYGPWILNYTDAVLGVGADYSEHGLGWYRERETVLHQL